ncbi:MAG TPA: hypothetical protein VIM65_19870 [Cyclobacteriaceae bacterium]
MRTDENIYGFLESNDFKLIEQNTSKYFGDHYDTFVNSNIEIRFSSSKSFETVDVRSKEKDKWYDLALVKALLHSEEKLNNVTTIEAHNDFLKKELNRINDLFSRGNYATTKKKLDELGNKRAKQMFPGMT